MANTPFAFTPAQGLRDSTAYPTNPGSEAQAREQIQAGMDQLRDYINNTIQPFLSITKASAFSAYSNVSQSIAAQTFTKVLFQTEQFDNKSEYDAVAARFTATADGIYAVSASVYWHGSQITGNLTELLLYKNGTPFRYLDQELTGAAGATQSNGTVIIKLVAGDYIELYAYSGAAISTQTISYGTYFELIQLAG